MSRTGSDDGKRATVAIASFQTLALLKVVVGAVRETAPAAELIVVDTGSTDGSREWAAARAGVRLERLDVERGAAAHGAALDRALALATRPILVTLDSDAIPLRDDWLARLTAPLESPEVAACGAAKDPREVSALRRIAARLLGRRPGPEWTYVRPNRTAYRVEALRSLGLSFALVRAPGERRGAAVGERLARGLVEAGRRVVLLPPAEMDALVAHLRHATMALSPDLFPGARPRDLRAARRRIDAFLATDRARRLAGSGE